MRLGTASDFELQTSTPARGVVAAEKPGARIAAALPFLFALSLFALFAQKAGAVDTEDLNLSSDRLVEWKVPTIPDTSSWTVLDVTRPGDCSGCNADVADNSKDDNDDIQAAVNKAQADGGGHVIYLPNGHYRMNLSNATDRVMITKGNIVIRCESAAGTTLEIVDPANDGPERCIVPGSFRPVGFCFSGGGSSDTQNWTDDYSKGETVLTIANTSAYSSGDWVAVEQNDTQAACGPLISHDNSKYNKFMQYAQLVCVDGEACDGTTSPSLSSGQIEIDSGLVYDYSSDICGGEKIKRWDFMENVGVENCTFQWESKQKAEQGCTDLAGSFLSNCDYNTSPHVGFRHTVNGWVTGNVFGRSVNAGLLIAGGGRMLVKGNTFKDVNSIHFNSAPINCNDGCGQNVFENNIFDGTYVGVNFGRGANGNVFAYNYGMQAGGDRLQMMHGKMARANLMEGNDTDLEMSVDSTWGSNGPFNTWYRNRVRSNGKWKGINSYNSDKFGVAPQLIGNWVGNHANAFQKLLGGADFDSRNTESWIERNVIRSDKFDLKPHSTTSCGTGAGDSCPGTNVVESNQSIDLANVPDSFYRSSAPSWWCQEACSWEGETGIGAFGDDFNQPLCKLPAQIRAEGGVCTPLNSPALLAPPVLLP